ncbi:hypothetical protein Aab01nite_81540 [Paractinoplanes abujensis]|uniref:Membrane protein n=1 Tax=Paractinoplanes abujensis TaxID=882441 RepID=A0A7W7CRG0_9ACTN|nr:YihY/virulence factor BrkB family protein [Actinoplanes abujensis]MBB4693360.1 membrane protein [Actinoplanes abujensis]GID24564.1 hypothetical protein Aab01nite_81540 [Actinoplanes abujensis]
MVRRLFGDVTKACRWLRRVRWVDRLVRAGVRYDEADGGRLSAAVTYYAFFATFALQLVAFAVFGPVLDDSSVVRSIQQYVAHDLPTMDVQALRHARATAGVIAFVGLPVTGWFWVDALRSSIRRIWRLPEYPGALAVRVLIDLGVLTGLGVLLTGSLWVAYVTSAAANRVADASDAGAVLSHRWLTAFGFLVGVVVNTVLACGALTALPRVRMSWRRLLGPALLVGVGTELLKTIGGVYVRLTEANPVYQLVAGAVGLLVFLNAINQMLLFAAALTATSAAGRSADLAEPGAGPLPGADEEGGRYRPA